MWKEPKTDWVSDDYINAEDYNRIIGNIAYLRELEQELYQPVWCRELTEKAVDEFPYAVEFNAIEGFLERLSEETFPFENFIIHYFYDGGPTPRYDELNRIEEACLAFYNGYNRQKLTRQRLSIPLGRKQSAIKC